jgi:signal transduction histidine kinase
LPPRGVVEVAATVVYRDGHVGVGLGAVYSIVDRVGGSVEISSAATGTMIAVRLPRA